MYEKLNKYRFIKSNLIFVPETPGIYIYFNTLGKAIYIGKAKSLRNRMRSYFNKNIYGKTDKLVNNIFEFSFIDVESEIDSIFLEAKLINKYKPYYNIALKDDKSPIYLYITDDIYPYVITARNIQIKAIIKYKYGPFSNLNKLNTILKNARKIIPYSTHKPSKNVCLNRQIGLCDPCPSEIVNTDDATKKSNLIKKYNKNIKNLRLFLDGKFIKLKKQYYHQMRHFSLEEDYENAQDVKNMISILDEITSTQIPSEYYLNDPYYSKKIRDIEEKDILKLLNMYIPISSVRRIECYDISHIFGSNNAGSMVTFIKGVADKKYYRHFKLKKSVNNDIYSLNEIASRRIRHFNDWGIPDLIIVDGGKPQVHTFSKIFGKYNIPVIGISKRYEDLVVPISMSKYEIVKLTGHPLKLITRIRNEAHRFAQRYHHKLVFQTLFKNNANII